MLALLLPSLANAQGSLDQQQPAHISADRVTLDNNRQYSRYQGQVEYRQGTLTMRGDEAEVYTDQGALKRLHMTGAPAHYEQRDEQNNILKGRARQIRYDAGRALLELRGNAVLCRAGEYFRADSIDYHTDTHAIEAGHANTVDKERVNITLQPSVPSETDCRQLP